MVRAPSKPAVVTLGKKGGVGKSLAARLLGENMAAWAMGDESPLPFVIDADFDNGLLERHLPDLAPHRLIGSLHEFAGWQELTSVIEAAPAGRPVLIDTPSNIGKALAQFGSVFGEVLAHNGRRFVRVYVIDQSIDTVGWLAEEARERPFDADCIVILNGMWGSDPTRFGYWHARPRPGGGTVGGKVRDAFLQAGGTELFIPRLTDVTMVEACRLHVSFAQAVPELMARCQAFLAKDLDLWLRKCRAALDPLRTKLGY